MADLNGTTGPKNINPGSAGGAPGGPLAGRQGRRAAPLDLSLGHIGTNRKRRRVFVEEGPDVFLLRVDPEKKTALLTVDMTYFDSFESLFKAMAEVMPLITKAGGYPGFGPVKGVDHG